MITNVKVFNPGAVKRVAVSVVGGIIVMVSLAGCTSKNVHRLASVPAATPLAKPTAALTNESAQVIATSYDLPDTASSGKPFLIRGELFAWVDDNNSRGLINFDTMEMVIPLYIFTEIGSELEIRGTHFRWVYGIINGQEVKGIMNTDTYKMAIPLGKYDEISDEFQDVDGRWYRKVSKDKNEGLVECVAGNVFVEVVASTKAKVTEPKTNKPGKKPKASKDAVKGDTMPKINDVLVTDGKTMGLVKAGSFEELIPLGRYTEISEEIEVRGKHLRWTKNDGTIGAVNTDIYIETIPTHKYTKIGEEFCVGNCWYRKIYSGHKEGLLDSTDGNFFIELVPAEYDHVEVIGEGTVQTTLDGIKTTQIFAPINIIPGSKGK